MKPENVFKLTIHGCQIQASGNLFAAAVFRKDEATGETNLIRSFFTHKLAPNGDALEQAIQYAKLNDAEAMQAETEAPGIEAVEEAQDESINNSTNE